MRREVDDMFLLKYDVLPHALLIRIQIYDIRTGAVSRGFWFKAETILLLFLLYNPLKVPTNWKVISYCFLL